MIAVVSIDIESSVLISEKLTELGINNIITISESELKEADKLIIPNIVELKPAIKKLHISNLFTFLRVVNKPILGIGMGLNVLCESSDDISCLGIFPQQPEARTVMVECSPGLKPIQLIKENKLFKGITETNQFYFDLIYNYNTDEQCVAVLSENVGICVAMKKNNYFGIQFRPEKSGEAGKKILRNFMDEC